VGGERAREGFARIIGADAEGVALVPAASYGLSCAARNLDVAAGDRLVVLSEQFPSIVYTWREVAETHGATLVTVPRPEDDDWSRATLDAVDERTAAVALPHCHWTDGGRLDLERIGARCREVGAALVLDLTQSAGALRFDAGAVRPDYVICAGYKWLLGPKGTGALFVRRDALDRVRLSFSGAHSHETMDYEGNYTLLPSAARYEFGTRALADFAGFARAVRWMEEIGFRRIHARIEELVEYATSEVRRAPELDLASPEPAEDRSGILVLRLPDRCDPIELYRDLGLEEDILASPVRGERDFRLSIHFFNTEEEITAALDAIRRRCR